VVAADGVAGGRKWVGAVVAEPDEAALPKLE
jgi:hypothetical protein